MHLRKKWKSIQNNKGELEMVKHIVMWKLKETFSEAEKKEIAQTFKQDLEALSDLMAGVIKIKVEMAPLESSNVDMMLDSEFDCIDTLNAYQVHPSHQKVSAYLKDKVVSRNCMDYTIE